MQKDVEKVYLKLQKRIQLLNDKDGDLKKTCRDKWDVNWYGMTRWEDEYEKRHKKIQDEIRVLDWWQKNLYELHLIAVEQGIEEGTKNERHYLGMDPEEFATETESCD